MSRLYDWYPNAASAVSIEDTRTNDGWASIRNRYAPDRINAALDRIIEIAKQHAVQSVLIEGRYIDPHYRSEHARFYAQTFQRHPSICHRLHFFTEVVDPSNLSKFQDAYRGYSVMRPIPSYPVGRTMLTPPPSLQGTFCYTEEEVHPLGWPLKVTAMPFISSDGQYLSCSHAVQWMVLYHAHLAHHSPRRLPGDIHDASTGGHVLKRASEGLTPSQVVNGLQALGMSASIIPLPWGRPEDEPPASEAVPPASSLFATICRYVNSQMPPIVLSDNHAWVVVGYRQTVEGGRGNCVLYRHDDQLGPYIEVADPWNDHVHGLDKDEPPQSWHYAVPPLPERLYMSAELAEFVGAFYLLEWAKAYRVAPVLEARNRAALTFRTFAIRSSEFKANLTSRLHSSEIEQLYRRAHMPGYIWVVEGIDRDRSERNQPSVVGEVIIDSTAPKQYLAVDQMLPAVLAVHAGGIAVTLDPDHGTAHQAMWTQFTPYESARPLSNW
jgi:hypothetical protein